MCSLIDAIMAFQDAAYEVDEASATALGVNRTDLRCLGILSGRGPQAPHELAELLHLTRAAVTSVIDRLEKLDLVRRVRAEPDRRRVEVNLTERAALNLQKLWQPLQDRGSALLATFTAEELASIERFLQASTDWQLAHAQSIRANCAPLGRANKAESPI